MSVTSKSVIEMAEGVMKYYNKLGTFTNRYMCPYCQQYTYATKMPHKPDCPVLRAEEVLKDVKKTNDA